MKKKKRERYFFCLQTDPGRNKTKKFSRHVECSQTIFSNIFRSFKKLMDTPFDSQAT